MNRWRTPDGREFIIGANEGFGAADTCVMYPRPTSLGNAQDAYVVEVTGKKFGKPFPLTLDINKPENCQAAKASRANAAITEHSVCNKDGAAFVMIEFGGNDAVRGIMLASGSQGLQVLVLQPQMVAAVGLPMPTDPKYPYK